MILSLLVVARQGLSFACSMMETNIKILLVEKRPLELLCDPKPDGREIALIHLSVAILKKMGVWQTISEDVISPLKEAFRVGSDIGAINVLKRYENKQVPITRLLYFGTNSIVALFTNDAPIAKQIRKVALKLASHFPPIKRVITRHLTHTNHMSKLLPFRLWH